MSIKDKLAKKLNDWAVCPKCKHDSIDGINGCPCKDKHCSCNPAAWSK